MKRETFYEEEKVIAEFRHKTENEEFKPEDLANLLEHYENLLQEMRFLTKIGDRLQGKLESAFFRIKNQNKQLERLNHNLELAVRSKTKELQQTVTTLDQYRFDLSHNFRVPIAALLGILDLLDNHSLTKEENIEIFEMIKKTSLRIDDVIKGLDKQLDVSTK